MFNGNMLAAVKPASDDSFPSAYFYSQPGATGPGYFDNLAPQVLTPPPSLRVFGLYNLVSPGPWVEAVGCRGQVAGGRGCRVQGAGV